MYLDSAGGGIIFCCDESIVMTTSSISEIQAETLACFDETGAPLTTKEVADQLGIGRRSAYERLEGLVTGELIQTKKVGASARVWWRESQSAADSAHDSASASPAGAVPNTTGRSQFDEQQGFTESLLNRQRDLVYAFDPAGEIERWNDRVTEVTGYSDDDIATMDPIDFVDESSHERVLSAMQQVFEGEPALVEAPLKTASGETIPYEFTGTPIRDSDGTVTGLTGIGRDISDRKARENRLERQRAELEAELNEVFTRISDGMFGLDDEYRITYINEHGASQLDKERAELIGRRFIDVFPEVEGTRFEAETFRAGRTQQPCNFEEYYDPLDGWFEVSMYPSESGISIYFRDVTERIRLETQLRTEKEQLRVAVENSPLTLFRLDTDLRYTWIGNAHRDFDEKQVLGKRDDELLEPAAAEAVMKPKREALETGESIRREVTYEIPSGEVTYDLTVKPLFDDDGEISGLICASLDITERVQAEQAVQQSEERLRDAIERLNVASRELIDADIETISGRIAQLTQEIVGVDYAAFWRYDKEVGELREGGVQIASGLPDVQYPANFDSEVWDAFVSNSSMVLDTLSDPSSDGVVIEECVLVPLGRHGVICAGETGREAIDKQTINLVKTMAATVESAWDRAQSEQELCQQNQELTRLDTLNSLIRQIDQALVSANDVETIDDAVCDRLTSSGQYEFAWIGEFDSTQDGLRPRAWAGVDDGYFDDLVGEGTGPFVDDDLFLQSIRSRSVQVIEDIATDPRAAQWREPTLERGGRSCLCIPLVYDETAYGVLIVYGSTPDHDDRDTAVLAELGQTVAHSINAVEAKATVQSNTCVELTVRTTAANTPLCRLSRELDCSLSVEGYVPTGGDSSRLFFTAPSASTDDLLEAGENLFVFESVTVLSSDTDTTLFRATVSDDTLASLFVAEGAVLQSVVIDSGVGTAVVELYQTSDVRAFLDPLLQSIPDLELLSRRLRKREFQNFDTIRHQFQSQLTDRQLEVLHSAYRSGFFESPRIQTGSELADSLDISQSTFTHHLRRAQRELCALVFDGRDA